MGARCISQVVVAVMLVGVAVAATVLASSIIATSISRREGRRTILTSVGVSDVSLGRSSDASPQQPIYVTVRVASFAESNVEIAGGVASVLLIGRSYARFVICNIFNRVTVSPGTSVSLPFVCLIEKQELRNMLPSNWNSDVLRSSVRVVTVSVSACVQGVCEHVFLV